MPAGGSSGGSSAAVRAGRAFVEIFAHDNMSKTLTRLQAKIAAFGSFVGKIGSGAILAGGALLAPVLALFAGMMEKAKAGMFGERAQADAEAFGAAWSEALTSMQSALVPVLAIVTPWMQQLATWVEQNKDLVKIMLAAGVALIAFGLAMKLAGIAIAGVAVIIGIVKMALLALLSPVGLVVAAVAGIGYVLATETETGKEFTSELKAGLMDTANTAKEAAGGIAAAFGKGDIELAMRIVGAALMLEWAKIDEFWTKKWVKFKDLFVDGWHEIKAAIAIIGNAIGTGLELALKHALSGFVWMVNNTLSMVAKTAAFVLDKAGLTDTANALRNWTPIGTDWLDKWEADIEQGHKAEEARIGDELAKKLDANRKVRDAQIAAVEMATAVARGQFADLVSFAKTAAADNPIGRPVSAGVITAVKGAFTSPNFQAALGFGNGTIDKQQLEVQKQILQEGKEMNQNIKAIKPSQIIK